MFHTLAWNAHVIGGLKSGERRATRLVRPSSALKAAPTLERHVQDLFA